MAKGLIIYFSVKGSTEQYARWLAEVTGFHAVDVKKEKLPDCSGYDCIVFGSCVRMGKINVSKWIKKLWPVIKEKKIFLFSVSGADPKEGIVQEYFQKNIPDNMREKIAYYPLGGRYLFTDMPKIVQFFIKLGARAEKEPQAREIMMGSFDRVKKENLENLITAIKNC